MNRNPRVIRSSIGAAAVVAALAVIVRAAPTTITSEIIGEPAVYVLNTPDYCYDSGVCASSAGYDRHTLTFHFDRPVGENDIEAATLTARGNPEYMIGKHDGQVESTCPAVTGANSFAGVPATGSLIGVTGTSTTFTLDSLEEFTAYPGLGMTWEAIKDWTVVDMRDALRQLLHGRPPTTDVSFEIRYLAGPCSSISYKSTYARLDITLADSQPHIDEITPEIGIIGSSVTISGSHFGADQGSSVVKFGTQPVQTLSWSDTLIKAAVPAVAAAYDVTVTTTHAGNAVPIVVKTLQQAAIDLAKSVVGAPYLGDAKKFGGKGWDYFDPARSAFGTNAWASAEQLRATGYFYYNALTPNIRPPGVGVDCSGLTFWAFNKAFGVTSYPSASTTDVPLWNPGANGQFQHNVTRINESQLLPGDLIFRSTGLTDEEMEHVALYVGPTPNGDVIEARGPGRFVQWRLKSNMKQAAQGVNQRLFFGRVRPSAPGVTISANSPVGLAVSDPDGYSITPSTMRLTGFELLQEVGNSLYYSVRAIDSAGHTKDVVTAPRLKTGVYHIDVVPHPGATATDTFGIDFVANGVTTTLAKDLAIGDAPKDGYTLQVTPNGGIEVVMPVAIDIKPQSKKDQINPHSRGEVAVAILSTPELSALNVDWTRVRFGKTGREARPVHITYRNVDERGVPKRQRQLDLVLRFDIDDTGIKCGDLQASLTGQMVTGQKFAGSGDIQTVGCRPSSKNR